ncbi:unnamed protein product [Toxocara canis]|uniref:50S ribosomal protein L18 n=1 Tax=Toxocara canis TaxID=6265 RepID=A0A183UEU9_TOXCA|nr:unnamed protein product [Toxocara canis]
MEMKRTVGSAKAAAIRMAQRRAARQSIKVAAKAHAVRRGTGGEFTKKRSRPRHTRRTLRMLHIALATHSHSLYATRCDNAAERSLEAIAC